MVWLQSLVSCGGGRRPGDGLRKQHVHTIRLLMWDTLEDLLLLGLHTWVEDSTLHACGRISTMTDVHLNHGTSLNSRDDYNNVGLYGKSRGGDDGQEDSPAPANLRCIQTRWKDMGGPLRTMGIAPGPPSRGGPTCKVYVKPLASSR